ncbi:MAG: hypothetical protein DRI36_04640 [Caldiserica bacterium]|nr:MAG: hypothetical protein DRI36_04640 [Caldisericota bacterium]
MHFLADECVPYKTITLLKKNGFKIFTVKDLKIAGKSDSIIFNKAKSSKLTLITIDSDFGNIILYPPKIHYGIILLKLNKPNEYKIHSLLIKFLKNTTSKDLKGKLIIIEPTKIRIRK